MSTQPCLPASPHHYPLTRLTALSLSGPDHLSYLQGQVTCDVAALPVGGQTLGGHCDPKGKLWASFRLLRQPDRLLMLLEQDLLTRQLPELKKYAVFAKLTIVPLSELPLWGLAGAGSDAWIAEQWGLHDTGLIEEGMACRLAADRWLLAGLAVDHSLPAAPEADWWGLEILAGLPHLSAIHQGEYIPQMINLQALGGISFHKGCYTGQEIVARAKYRGANNRALYCLQGQAGQPVSPGEVLELALEEGHWKRTGLVLDVWQQGADLLLSAVLPQDLAPSARLRLKQDEQSQLTIRPLPYSLAE